MGTGLGGAVLTGWDVLPLLPVAGDMANAALPGAMSNYERAVDQLINNNNPFLNSSLAMAANSQATVVGALDLIQQVGQSNVVTTANGVRTDIVNSFYSHPATIAVSDAIFGLPGQISNAFANGVRAILPTPRSPQLLNNLTPPPPPPPPPPANNNGQFFGAGSP